ncbi:MAG: hypothetical protein HY356_03300 [Gammaproteobacteria bacterium]|nr:hypothetical protein [Gammaproteobacteria bacterium]
MNTEMLSVGAPRVASADRGAGWLADGFGYFKRSAVHWILATILLFVISFIVMLIPLLGSLLIYLLMTVFMGGLMLGCYAQQQGGEFTVNHLFAGFSQNTGQLVLLGVLNMVGNIIILILLVIFIIFAPGGGMEAINTFMSGDQEAIEGLFTLFTLVALVGLALYMPLLMAFWFAPALVMLSNVPAMNAIKMSFMGCLYNIVPFLIYGIVGLILAFIATIPLMLGWLIFMPMIVASIYIAFREIYTTS